MHVGYYFAKGNPYANTYRLRYSSSPPKALSSKMRTAPTCPVNDGKSMQLVVVLTATHQSYFHRLSRSDRAANAEPLFRRHVCALNAHMRRKHGSRGKTDASHLSLYFSKCATDSNIHQIAVSNHNQT